MGLALWMSWKLGMQVREIIALTWDQVDLEREVIRLEDREIPAGATLHRLLKAVRDRRPPEADPHVLLTPRSGRSIDQPRLSKIVRTALIRGGLENVTLGDLCREEKHSDEDARLLALAAERGRLSRGEVMELLGVSKVAAYERLKRLTVSGELVRVGGKYYPAGKVVPPEEHYAAIRAYLKENGAAYRQDLAGLLRIGPRQCSLILRRMVADGQLAQMGQRYCLPGPPKGKPYRDRRGQRVPPVSFTHRIEWKNMGECYGGAAPAPGRVVRRFSLSLKGGRKYRQTGTFSVN